MLSNPRLEQSRRAYQAVCEMLTFPYLSMQLERQLNNVKKLLELEISDLESRLPDHGDGGGGVAAD